MNPEAFITAYEKALAAQDWKVVEPLMSDNICVTFSNSAVNVGKDKVREAFEHNFKTIKSEKYAIENVKWIKKEENYAVYVFDFSWTGIINGKSMSGNGIGTSVLSKENGQWKLLTEHLGRKEK